MPKLTKKEQLFCREYLKDFNASQAFVRAGYSKNGARQSAAQLFEKPAIRAEVKRLVNDVMERAEIDAVEVLSTIKQMALVDPIDVCDEFGNLRPMSLIPKPARQCISSIRSTQYGTSVKLEGRLKALDMLGKYLQLWQDGVNFSVGDGGPPTVVFDFTGTTRGPGDTAATDEDEEEDSTPATPDYSAMFD